MGRDLRTVAETIVSDLGMGEDLSKIDALELSLKKKLNSFFAEESHRSVLPHQEGGGAIFYISQRQDQGVLDSRYWGRNHYGRRGICCPAVLIELSSQGGVFFATKVSM